MSSRQELLSSDDSDVPVIRTRSVRTKLLSYKADFKSESDDEEIKFVKVDKAKPEKLLGEISLLTSDEEFIPEPTKSKKRVLNKTTSTRTKKLHTIELVTSDEDQSSNNVPTNTRKKRKLVDFHLEATSSQKKAKTVQENKPCKKKKLSVSRKVAFSKSSLSPIQKLPVASPDGSINNSINDVAPIWQDSQLLAEKTLIDEDVAQNLIKLWEEGNTIPFIARYRKNVIGGLTPEALRTAKEDYDEICDLKKRMCTVAKAVEQTGKLDEKIQRNICAARTVEELEHIYAPFKPGKKRTLVERAKSCGLEEPALHLLNNTGMVFFTDYQNPDVDGIKTEEEVKNSILNILASEIATDPELLAFLRELRRKSSFRMRTTKVIKATRAKETAATSKIGKKNLKTEEAKFEMYFDFENRTDVLKSHQILAINRAESLKFLNVKIEIPEFFEKQFKYFCTKKWTDKSRYDQRRQDIINAAIDDAFRRLVGPLITREIRTELKHKAEKESCKVFSDNLKHLLLTTPIKGKSILGIDPGFTNGCKLGLISPTGFILAQNVIYPHRGKNNFRGEAVIKSMLTQYGCNLIAIGNGSACRETEEWISDLIKTRYFGNLDVQYTIVNEDGASIYSCSPEARKEFGDMDPNIISAVSLARRIQDPMAELVKVEPCHLGIGMYQLDIKKKQLEDALNEVVSECVSFVGVDINTASQCLLRRVAGLTANKATQIIDYRERCGPFTHRKELLKVFGIGERIFEQCAGFLRVGPTDPDDKKFYSNKLTTPLDATVIHPESYPVVRKLLGKMGLNEKEVGSEYFIKCFKAKSQDLDIQKLSETYTCDTQNLHLITDALSRNLNYDLRTEASKTPLFKKGIRSLENLEIGTILTGRVKNVTSFGAFVDIGVGNNGLIHNSHMKGRILHLGDVLEVQVVKMDLGKGHINLAVLNKLN